MAVADIFTALAEDRPYRQGLARDKALGIMADMAGRGLIDDYITGLLARNYDEVVQRTLAAQRSSHEEYGQVL